MKMKMVITGLLVVAMAGGAYSQEIAVTSSVKVGSAPRGIAISADGAKCYVADINTGNVDVISTATKSVIKTLNVGGNRGARNPIVAPNGKFVVVLAPPDAVAIIDTATDTVVSNIYIPIPPANIAFSSDGTTLLMYILTAGSYNYMTKIDCTTFSITAQIEMPNTILFNGFVITKDNRYAIATTAWSADPVNFITIVDIQTMQIISKIPVGKLPVSVVLDGAGSKAYVANYSSSSVSVVDIATLSTVGEILLGAHPYRLRLDKSGKRVWAVSDNADIIGVIDTTTNSLSASLALPGISTPKNDIVFSPDKRLAVATASDAGTVNLIDATKFSLLQSVPVGGLATDIVIAPDGKTLYVLNETSGNVIAVSLKGYTMSLKEAILVAIASIKGYLATARLPERQNDSLKKALGNLEGNRDDKSENGALDKLAEQNLEATLEKVKKAIQLLAGSRIDFSVVVKALAEAAAFETDQYILAYETAKGISPATTLARELLGKGNGLLASGDYAGALSTFKKAVDNLEP